MPRFALLLGACVFAGLLAVPVPAFANLSVRLIYVRDASAQSCPDEADLRAAVRRRIGYEAFYPWAKTTVVVEVARDGHGSGGTAGAFRARVQLADATGVARGTQELHSAGDCRSAVDAAALAISIALEAEEAAQATAAGQQASAQPPPEATPPPEEAPVPAPPAPAPVNLAAQRPATDSAHGSPESRNRYRFVAGLDGLAAFGDAPDVVAGADLWAEVRSGFASLGIEVQGNLPETITLSNGRAELRFFAAVVDPCAHIGPAFFCAVGSLAWIQAEGSNVSSSHDGSAIAIAVGPRAGVEWPLGGALSIRARGDFLVDVLRPDGVAIFRGSNPAAWPMPELGGTLALGVAYRFP